MRSATEKISRAKAGLDNMKNRPGVVFRYTPLALSRIFRFGGTVSVTRGLNPDANLPPRRTVFRCRRSWISQKRPGLTTKWRLEAQRRVQCRVK